MRETWARIKSIFGNDWVSPMFLVLFLAAWTANAFKKTTFDLTQLRDMYTTIRGALLIEHGINSGLNSKMGEMPKDGVGQRGEA